MANDFRSISGQVLILLALISLSDSIPFVSAHSLVANQHGFVQMRPDLEKITVEGVGIVIPGQNLAAYGLRGLLRFCSQISSYFGVLSSFTTPAASTGRPPPTVPGLRYVASETTRLKNSFVEASERRRTRGHSVIVSFLDLQMLGFVNRTSKGPYIQFSGKLQFGNEYKLSRVESFEVSGEFVDANLEVAISNSMIDRKSLNDDCDLVFSEHNCYDDSSQYSSAFSELQLEVLSNVFSVWSDFGSEFSERSSSHKKPNCGSDVQDGVKISSDVDEADAVTFYELVYGWHYKVFFVGSTLFALQQLFGIVNISGSVIAMILMDKLGRRVLLLRSFTGMTLSMGLQATAASSLVSGSGVMYLSVGDNYLQLFAHFFDEKWKLKEWVLKFCSVYSFAVVGCSVPVFLPEDSTISKVSINLVITRCFGPMILLEHLSVSEYFGDSSEGHLENNEGDPELLIFIPFTSDVKIKSISIVGGADGTSPSKMRAFINQEGIDFSDAQSMQPAQEWDFAENLQGVLEYQTKYSRFQGVGNLTLHFPDNFGGDTTRLIYIGLKGEATQLKRDVVATIVYEIMPNPSDHKTKAVSEDDKAVAGFLRKKGLVVYCIMSTSAHLLECQCRRHVKFVLAYQG